MPRKGRKVFSGRQLLVSELLHVGWSAFSSANAKGSGLGAHVHDDAYEICFLMQGEVHWWIGNETYDVGKGDLFVTKPGEDHGGVDGVMHPCELYWLQLRFPPGEPLPGLGPRESKRLEKMLSGIEDRVTPSPLNVGPFYEGILAAHETRDGFARVKVRSFLHLLLAEVAHAYDRPSRLIGRKNRLSAKIRKSVHYFQQHLYDDASVEEAGRMCGLKPSQFRALFRKETGFSPIEYWNQLRVKEAQKQLTEGRTSITEIGLRLNFSSSQHFATTFKKLTGITPSAYRMSRS